MQDTVDIAFRITCQQSLPSDYSYPLYAALAHQWPWLHEAEDVGVFPLGGSRLNNQFMLKPHATLRLRAASILLPKVIGLTGQCLAVGHAEIQVGIPHVIPLCPSPSLYGRFVQIKLAHADQGITPGAFLGSARKQLDAMGIQAQACLPLHTKGQHTGQPQRRVLTIKGQKHVGFSVLVEGLTADESLQLQQQGLGGRRKMGCGLFLPFRGT